MQQNIIKDSILWFAIVLITAASLFTTYHFSFTSPIVVMLWIGWLVVVGGTAFFTTSGQTIFQFSKEAKRELQKVVWPSRQETVQTTMVVMAMVALTGLVLWGVDSLMMWIIAGLTHLG